MRRSQIHQLVLVLLVAACRPGDILDVPPPSGEFSSSAIQGPQTAAAAYAGARSEFSAAMGGDGALLEWVSLLSDEFQWGELGTSSSNANIDARLTSAVVSENHVEPADGALQSMLNARSSLLIAEGSVQQYGGATEQSSVGEAFALAGYAELLLAESYCAGVTLSQATGGGGWIYGTPLTTDSLLGTAEVHFDSALAHASGNDTIQALASVGLGRTLLDRAQYAAAATAVASVPTDFVYDMQSEPSYSSNAGTPSVYAVGLTICGEENVSDREGGNGLDFISAQDPRLVIDSTLSETCDSRGFFTSFPDTVWYYPTRFGNPSTLIPLATGVEARLIEAEAAWQNGDPSWATDLSALRADSADTHVSFLSSQVPIPTDSTTGASDSAQVDLLFRERAFWLFGTGTRLGDMRRLIRQYHRDQSTVFPVGPYATGIRAGIQSYYTTYGTDVSLTLPTAVSGSTTTNPYYKGCISPASTA